MLAGMNEISITPLSDGRFDVHVRGGSAATRHQVAVPRSMIDDPQLGAIEPERLVKESMEFLLEREPASSILSEFSLDVIPRYFREYDAELRRRLSVSE
jgi:hypothetical protein